MECSHGSSKRTYAHNWRCISNTSVELIQYIECFSATDQDDVRPSTRNYTPEFHRIISTDLEQVQMNIEKIPVLIEQIARMKGCAKLKAITTFMRLPTCMKLDTTDVCKTSVRTTNCIASTSMLEPRTKNNELIKRSPCNVGNQFVRGGWPAEISHTSGSLDVQGLKF